jgi:hypothetical protein
MDEFVAAAEQHITALEARVARQSRLVEQITLDGGDATAALHNLRLMEEAVEVMRMSIFKLLPSTTIEALQKAARRKSR